MQLHYREYGQRSDTRPTVLLLHGLFGSAANWHGIARRMQERVHVVSPDLRNHGRSPHNPDMDYPAMADDVLELIDAHGFDQVCLVGHSMGGKAAMWLALEHQERVSSLVAVDIAPVDYAHDFSDLLDALETIPLESLANRAAADQVLTDRLESADLRGYLLQNLVKEDGGWTWRINLPVLRACMANIVGFPEQEQNRQFLGDTLFLHGGRSDYVSAENARMAHRLFPHARLRMIAEAGHWVYSEAPEAFVAALSRFLSIR